MDILFCDICNESVPEVDLAEGRAVRRAEKTICASCEGAMSTPGAPGPAASSGSPATSGVGVKPTASGSKQGSRHGSRSGSVSPALGAAAWTPPPPSHAASAIMGLVLGSLAIVMLAVAAVLGMERLGGVESRWAGEVSQLRKEMRSTERSQASEQAESRRSSADQNEQLLARVTASERSTGDEVRRSTRALDAMGRRLDELGRDLERMQLRDDETGRNAGRLEAQGASVEELRDDIALLARRLLDLEQAAVSGGLAVAAAPALKPEPDWMPLVVDLEDDNASTRWLAVTSLGDTGDVAVTPHLVPRLADDDLFVRMAAARILGDLRSRAAVPALIAALSDQEHSVREAAVVSLRLITGQNFKFDSNESESDRNRRIKAWSKWWEGEQEAKS